MTFWIPWTIILALVIGGFFGDSKEPYYMRQSNEAFGMVVLGGLIVAAVVRLV